MRFGITQTFDCSYLPDEQERLLVYADNPLLQAERYGQLIQLGFRRSGEQIYRPHCATCSACESVRVPVEDFIPSKSQKRLLNKNKSLTIRTSNSMSSDYYPLYERYINERHADGTMYPPSEEQFTNFIACDWKSPMYIEAYDGEQLIAVAVTDVVDHENIPHGLSALYTFFDPDYENQSLGTWMILQQIVLAKAHHRPFVYLGYYVEGCKKMSYKHKFHPFEQFSHNNWLRIDKNPAY